MESALILHPFKYFYRTAIIDYDLYSSRTNDDRLMIYETWESREALKAHAASEHFKRLVPQLEQLATMTLEEFEF